MADTHAIVFALFALPLGIAMWALTAILVALIVKGVNDLFRRR